MARRLLAALLLAVPASAAATNVLLIVSDDLGADKLAAFADYGSYTPGFLPNTPALDDLSAAGLSFTAAWASPTCSPTRSGIITGMLPHRTGVGWAIEQGTSNRDLDNTAWNTLADRLHDAGYATGMFGKWHVGTAGSGGNLDWDIEFRDPDPTVVYEDPHMIGAGFDTYVGDPDGAIVAYTNWSKVTAPGDGTATITVERFDADDVVNEQALAWINAQTTPWFAMIGYYAPHTAKTDTAGYDADNVDPSCYVDACIADNSCGDWNGDGSTLYDYQMLVLQSMIECQDRRVDDLLSSIAGGALRDTLVVFVGDNGTVSSVMEAPYRTGARDYGKGTAYETGVRVPLIIADGQHWVDLQAGRSFSVGDIRSPGREVTSSVTTVDLYDTILEALGLPEEPGTDSVSLWGCANSASATCATPSGGRPVYTEGFIRNPRGLLQAEAAYRSGRHKLVMSYDSTLNCLGTELYDLSADPHETTNIARTSSAVARNMRNSVTALGVSWMSGLRWCR